MRLGCVAFDTIYLVRHGETSATCRRVFEGSGRAGGELGSSLTPEGVRQAEAIARALEHHNVVKVFTSPSLRTVQTAGIVCLRLGAEPVVLPDMREGCFGLWEGLTFDEIQSAYPRLVDAWFADPVNFTPPAGESVMHMADRAWKCLLTMVSSGRGCPGAAVVVTHGGPIRAIVARCLYGQLDAFGSVPQNPGAINVLRCEADSLVVDAVNVTA